MKITEKIKKLKTAIKLTNSHPQRIEDDEGNPGGLIDLSKIKKVPIMVGDLHGSYENIKEIVHHENNQKKLKNNEAVLIILGDAVHNDQTGYMKEMASSLVTIEYVIDLINVYKENVIYIRGNHDTFDDRLRKSGIAQGTEFRNHLLEHRNEDYVNLIENFFDCLPLVIIGKKYLITHGGPVRGGITREEIINIKKNDQHYHQLIWNRVHEFRGTPNEKEYGEKDIAAMLKKLKLPVDTHFIVGHNPLWHTGNTTGVWKDVTGIKNHYIIYTNLQTHAPYLTYENGELVTKFAISPKPEVYYV
ncbi:MAG: metallophosphoesterase [Spirochaetes bacterium]|nr:metallophosphoesterase [Spirochaetota bacterium]